jgi:hypothetical protein
MDDQAKQFDTLAAELAAMELPSSRHGAVPAVVPADICSVWKAIKPFVETGIKLLKLLPFAWAKKLADALQILADALNALCP